MSTTSISAIGGAYSFSSSPYTPPAASTRAITQMVNGATVTTVRGATGDVVAVSTARAAAQGIAMSAVPQSNASQSNMAPAQTLYMIA